MNRHSRLSKVNGATAVSNFRQKFVVMQDPDGLTFAKPSDELLTGGALLPPRLQDLLTDLRVLRGIPLAYLVPDPALLPPESVRFFHIDPTWVDRVVDGVLSAASIGTVEMLYSVNMLALVRTWLDQQVGSGPMTGMLIRSELVRRWPGIQVEAFSTTGDNEPDSPIEVVRAEPISSTIFIAIFAAEPRMVHVHQPDVGLRFGVEEKGDQPNTSWNIEGHDKQNISRRPGGLRVVDVLSALQSAAGDGGVPSLHSSTVANILLRKPYAQVYRAADTGLSEADSLKFEHHGSIAQTDSAFAHGGFGFTVRGVPVDLSVSGKSITQSHITI